MDHDRELLKRLDKLAGRSGSAGQSDDVLMKRLQEMVGSQSMPKGTDPSLLSEEDAMLQRMMEEVMLEKRRAQLTDKQEAELRNRLEQNKAASETTSSSSGGKSTPVLQRKNSGSSCSSSEAEALLQLILQEQRKKQQSTSSGLGRMLRNFGHKRDDLLALDEGADDDDEHDDPMVQSLLESMGKQVIMNPTMSDKEIRDLLKVTAKEIRATRSKS